MTQKSYFFLLISVVLWLNKVNAQTLQQTIHNADSLLTNGNFDDALKTYKRALYFSDTSFKTKSHLYENLGSCYFNKKDYLVAAEQFTYALLFTENALVKNELRLQKIKCLLMAHNFDDARAELFKIDTLQFTFLAPQLHFYNATLAFAQNDFTASKAEFLYLAGNDEIKKQQINKLFKKLRRSNNKNALLASVMSGVLPGTGQIYAGEIEKGLNSFLLTSAWLVLGYNTAVVYGVGHAILAVAPWYLRYYTFGINDAAALVEQQKLRKKEKILQQLLNLSAQKK